MQNNIVFIGSSLVLIALLVYFIFIRKPIRGSYSQPSQIKRNRQARGNDQCCICLSEQKKFQVSITCGHSFCGKCLLGLHAHSNQKLKCPLCRNDINIIFRVFSHDQQPKRQGEQLQQKLRQYNNKFQDNRSFLRKLNEFPFVLRALKDRLFGIDFIRFFLSSTNLMKMFMTMMIYIIIPIDLLPQFLLGPAGYLDDFGFMIVVFLYTVANSAIEYVRRRQ